MAGAHGGRGVFVGEVRWSAGLRGRSRPTSSPAAAWLGEVDPSRLVHAKDVASGRLGRVPGAWAGRHVGALIWCRSVRALTPNRRRRGIGPWTVADAPSRGLGDRDVMPSGDLGVRHAAAARGGDESRTSDRGVCACWCVCLRGRAIFSASSAPQQPVTVRSRRSGGTDQPRRPGTVDPSRQPGGVDPSRRPGGAPASGRPAAPACQYSTSRTGHAGVAEPDVVIHRAPRESP